MTAGADPLTILAVKASLLTGYWLYRHLSGGADATYDAIATVTSAFWVLAGIFTILGGFVISGSLIIVLFSYISLTKGARTKRRLRRRIVG